MQYLGGKSRLAKRIVAAIAADTELREVWEPFCGGAAVTAAFQKSGFSGLASDVHPALISMYRALQKGWRPPRDISEDDYKAAKALPDADPRKAFFAFGCSFGGMEWGGYARSGARHHGNETCRNIDGKAGLWSDSGWDFERLSFFDVRPFDLRAVIYCDPPYEGTQGYKTGAFDHAGFWALCQEWARYVPVYVSEFHCSVPHIVLLEISRTRAVNGGVGRPTVVDRLYRVLPSVP